MAKTQTENHEYFTQDKGDQDWHTALNDTIENLDVDVPVTDVEGNRPSAGTEGRVFIATDTEKIFYDDGGSWQDISPGGSGANVLSVSSDTSLGVNDNHVIVDTSSGDVTVDLPAAGDVGSETFNVKKDFEANVLTVETDGSETIDGEASLDVVHEDSNLQVLSDGSNWVVV